MDFKYVDCVDVSDLSMGVIYDLYIDAEMMMYM